MKLFFVLLALPMSSFALEPAIQDLAKVIEDHVSCKIVHESEGSEELIITLAKSTSHIPSMEQGNLHTQSTVYKVATVLGKSGVDFLVRKEPRSGDSIPLIVVPFNKKVKVGDLDVLCEKAKPAKKLSRREQRRINRDSRNIIKEVNDSDSSKKKSSKSSKQ